MIDCKKIVFVGSDHPAALELIFMDILRKQGIQVQIFPAQTIFLKFYNRSLFHKIIYRLGLSLILNQIQELLKQFIIKEKPSAVFVFKGMEITPKTLIWIKSQGIMLYNYNPDHPFIFSGRGSGNKHVTKSVSFFDFYFSYASDVVIELKKRGLNSEVIPFGFDSNGFEYIELKKADEIVKVCFLGNADKFRAQFINKLEILGLEIHVYGENWNNYKMNKGVTIFSAKYGLEFWLTLQRYAIQLNILRPHNYTTHNMRSFDIPGAGGIMLAPYTDDHARFFQDQSEIFLFQDVDDASRICQQVLGMSFEERQQLRKAARIKALKEHTYTHRIGAIIKCFEA